MIMNILFLMRIKTQNHKNDETCQFYKIRKIFLQKVENII